MPRARSLPSEMIAGDEYLVLAEDDIFSQETGIFVPDNRQEDAVKFYTDAHEKAAFWFGLSSDCPVKLKTSRRGFRWLCPYTTEYSRRYRPLRDKAEKFMRIIRKAVEERYGGSRPTESA